jgi:hypothetical protein
MFGIVLLTHLLAANVWTGGQIISVSVLVVVVRLSFRARWFMG